MSIATVQKLSREMFDLRKDIFEIKQIILEVVGDPEGEYQNTFVKKIQKRANEKSTYRFNGAKTFLRQVYGAKK